MDGKNTGGPAFPTEYNQSSGERQSQGMTLRDYFAAKAMQSLVLAGARGDISYGNETVLGKRAYEFADAMLSAREA